MERLRGQSRLSIRRTEDGLGIHIPPGRNADVVGFMSLWLCGWAAGEYFALSQFFGGGISVTDVFLLIWIMPWTLGGAGVLWVVVWQLFGIEQLFVTAGALVREWRVLGVVRTRMVYAADILSVEAVAGRTNDIFGLGAVKVATTGRTMHIGSGLSDHEAELVALLIGDAADNGRQAPAGRSEG